MAVVPTPAAITPLNKVCLAIFTKCHEHFFFSVTVLSHWLGAARGSLASGKPAVDFRMQQLELFFNELPATRNLRSAFSQSPHSNVAGGTVA